MTPQETKLWTRLRALKPRGWKFRRQVPLGPYIVDFACFRPKLVIEVDGGQQTYDRHQAKDRERDAWLEGQGFQVHRAWNHEVDGEMDAVLDAILRVLEGS